MTINDIIAPTKEIANAKNPFIVKDNSLHINYLD